MSFWKHRLFACFKMDDDSNQIIILLDICDSTEYVWNVMQQFYFKIPIFGTCWILYFLHMFKLVKNFRCELKHVHGGIWFSKIFLQDVWKTKLENNYSSPALHNKEIFKYLMEKSHFSLYPINSEYDHQNKAVKGRHYNQENLIRTKKLITEWVNSFHKIYKENNWS